MIGKGQKFKNNYMSAFKAQDHCCLYEKYHFAHGEHELRTKTDLIPVHVPSSLTSSVTTKLLYAR